MLQIVFISLQCINNHHRQFHSEITSFFEYFNLGELCFHKEHTLVDALKVFSHFWGCFVVIVHKLIKFFIHIII